MHQDHSAFRHTNIASEIRELAPTAVLARIYPLSRSVTQLYASDFQRLLIDRRIEEDVARIVRRRFAKAADWRIAHDFYLPDQGLYLTPEPHQLGYVPEDDQCFGISLSQRICETGGGCDE